MIFDVTISFADAHHEVDVDVDTLALGLIDDYPLESDKKLAYRLYDAITGVIDTEVVDQFWENEVDDIDVRRGQLDDKEMIAVIERVRQEEPKTKVHPDQMTLGAM